MERNKVIWELKRIGDLVVQSRNLVAVIPQETYSLLGLSLEGRGLFVREQKLGGNLSSNRINKVQAGQFIYSRLFAWKGAFDIVSDNFNGCFVSDEFPTFEVKEQKADAIFLNYYFQQAKVWKEVEQHCIGVTKASRNRFKENFFLNFSIHLPPVLEQKRIVSKIEEVKFKFDEIKALRTEQEKDINNLLFSKYTELIKNATWRPFREIAPIIRREVTLNEAALYPELGIRCFGKGTFHKPALTGAEVGTKKIFQIKAGDLIFSNVFAWEGGIAVAREEDNNRYGSHRFISCVPDKEVALVDFLCFHFLSPKGMEDIIACSPGGAGRNKTLGLTKLMNIKVPVPDIELQKDFVALLEKVDAIKNYHKQNEQELEGLMPSLLDKAFKGEL